MEESTSGPMDPEQEEMQETTQSSEQENTPVLVQEVIEQGLEKKKEPPQPKVEFIAQKRQGHYVGHIRINGQVLRGVLGSGSSKKETKENLIKNWMANVQNVPAQAGVNIEEVVKTDIE